MAITNKLAWWCIAFLLTGAAGCTGIKQESLKVLPGERVAYQCSDGERIIARCYSLSDKSLDFVKLHLPDGKEATLPQSLSASGVRYINDVEWVWWTKGDSAFAETRGPNGDWQIRYDNCREIR